MAEINETQIEEIVAQVIRNLQNDGQRLPTTTSQPTAAGASDTGIFPTVDQAIAAAKAAQVEFVKLGFAKRREIIEAIRRTALEHSRSLAEIAVEDTKMGVVEHKVMKNDGGANLSPGVEDLSSEATTGDTGLLLVEYLPFGVINSITPTTNPTSTVINHAIIMLSAGNSVVFSPHPNAQRCTQETMKAVCRGDVAAGEGDYGPPGYRNGRCTGGGSVVRAALTSGKKAIAAGPGNPPAIIDETADPTEAAKKVILGNSFDNNLLCIGEKALFVVESVADEVIRELQNSGGYLTNPRERQAVEDVVIQNGDPNIDYIGKDASVILDAAGIRAKTETVSVVVEVPGDHTFVVDEYLMPVLPVVRVT
ncbi:Ethanolamine utilization protein EutE [Geodia barretti]|uniref:Ethanolamine utilization protein EutE n=1 Tax=Geodia barretti TaxID=519541 RepID=A0AA35W0J3_GEOBA|nr:Ethanolamine utilization protein EutE [Geodia barretti]